VNRVHETVDIDQIPVIMHIKNESSSDQIEKVAHCHARKFQILKCD
jgi:hypothetical protein